MTTFTHILMGTAIAKAALTGKPGNYDTAVLYAVSILFANIPDIDIPLFGLKKSVQFKWNHRLQSFLHYPITWLVAGSIIWLLLPVPVKTAMLPYVPIAVIALVSHFILDTVGIHYGICWFGPFIKKDFSITRLIERPTAMGTFLATYVTSVGFKIEMLVWIGSLWYLFIRHA